MKQETMTITLSQLIVGENPRLSINYDEESMFAAISQDGLETPIWVRRVSEEEYRIIRGHRRHKGLILLNDRNPERFLELFPRGGIPVVDYSDLTDEEEWELKIDEGNQRPLNHEFELQICVNHLLAQGKSEKQVVTKVSSLIDRIKPMKPKVLKDLKVYDEKLAEATKTGDVIEVARLEAKRIDRVFKSRRGVIQHLNRVFRSPNIVMETQRFHATGVQPDEFAGDYLPVLTQEDIKGLFDEFTADLADEKYQDANGISEFNKRNPGPKFIKKWGEIVAADKDRELAKATGEKAPRAKSRKDMEKEVTEGKWLSKGFNLLTKHHAGQEVSGVTESDKVLYFAEQIKTSNPKLWAEIESEVKESESLNKEGATEVSEAKKVSEVSADTKKAKAKAKKKPATK